MTKKECLEKIILEKSCGKIRCSKCIFSAPNKYGTLICTITCKNTYEAAVKRYVKLYGVEEFRSFMFESLL